MHVPNRVIRPQSPATTTSSTQWVAAADVPTRFGMFAMHVFYSQEPSLDHEASVTREHVALVHGSIENASHLPIRIHSECLTSEVFGSLKCDCKEQLDAALEQIAKLGAGAVLYLRQEGRGIGLANKIRAYALQSKGADTVDANRLLGLPDDARQYHAAADMLRHFGVTSVQLMTNNPAKIKALRSLGIDVTQRLPSVVATNPYSAAYLETKRERMAHELPARARSAVPSQDSVADAMASRMARTVAAGSNVPTSDGVGAEAK